MTIKSLIYHSFFHLAIKQIFELIYKYSNDSFDTKVLEFSHYIKK